MVKYRFMQSAMAARSDYSNPGQCDTEKVPPRYIDLLVIERGIMPGERRDVLLPKGPRILGPRFFSYGGGPDLWALGNSNINGWSLFDNVDMPMETFRGCCPISWPPFREGMGILIIENRGREARNARPSDFIARITCVEE
jgi:hypothetical protein